MYEIEKEEYEKLQIMASHFEEIFCDGEADEVHKYTEEKLKETNEFIEEDITLIELALIMSVDAYSKDKPLVAGGLISYAIKNGVLNKLKIV